MRTFIRVGKSIVNVHYIRSVEYIPHFRKILFSINGAKSAEKIELEFVTEAQAENMYKQYSNILLAHKPSIDDYE